MNFYVQHTCSNKGGNKQVLKDFPYLSIYNPQENKTPFLGEGYYFWDYNLEYAKVWGKNHYSNEYFICQSEISIDSEKDGYFLDLAGNREHLVGFVGLLWEFNLIHKDGTEGIDLCYIIDYLRTQCPSEVFPFEVIRAVDYENNEQVGIKIVFNQGKKSFTILNPRVIISFKNKENIVHLNEPFIVYSS